MMSHGIQQWFNGLTRKLLALALIVACGSVSLSVDAVEVDIPPSAATPEQTDNDHDGFCEDRSSTYDTSHSSSSPDYVCDTYYSGGLYPAGSYDCNDTNANIGPHAIEVANNIDDDCDGVVDDNLPDPNDVDNDHDKFCENSSNGYDGNGDSVCDENIPGKRDCDDEDSTIHSDAVEVADGKDNNCNGEVDEGLTQTPPSTALTLCQDALGNSGGPVDELATSLALFPSQYVKLDHPSWSLDGKMLAFSLRVTGSSTPDVATALCLYDKSATTPVITTLFESLDGSAEYLEPVFMPVFSSFQNSIMFVKNTISTGKSELRWYVFETGESVPMDSSTTGKIHSFRLSAGVGSLQYVYMKNTQISTFNLSTGVKATYQPVSGQTFSQPAVDDNGVVYAISRKSGETRSKLVKLSGTSQVVLPLGINANFELNGPVNLVHVASDGSSVFYDQGSDVVGTGVGEGSVGASLLFKWTASNNQSTELPSNNNKYSRYGGAVLGNDWFYTRCTLLGKDDPGNPVCASGEDTWSVVSMNLVTNQETVYWSATDYNAVDPYMSVSSLGDLAFELNTGTILYTATNSEENPALVDQDGDDYPVSLDCNDTDAAINPAARDLCADGIDQDCSGQDSTTSCQDADGDGDGYSLSEGECNDANAAIHPGAEEIADNVDNDCDGTIDEVTDMDVDNDGYTPTGGDCNDNNAAQHPNSVEICGNGIDENCVNGDSVCATTCSTGTLTTYYQDADQDGYGNEDVSTQNCTTAPTGYVATGTDCDDTNAAVHPGAAEVTNGIDDDCDGTPDVVVSEGECIEGLDDCDGDRYSIAEGDCNDSDASRYPGAAETTDSKDNDCDGVVDETSAFLICTAGDSNCQDPVDGGGSSNSGGGCSLLVADNSGAPVGALAMMAAFSLVPLFVLRRRLSRWA